MTSIVNRLKQLIPRSLKQAFKDNVTRLRKISLTDYFRDIFFKPYIKKKDVEGVSFDFWIGDPDGRDWYDLQAGDPVWAEMRFIKDQMVKSGDIILEAGGHHGCTAIILSNWVGEKGKVVTFEPLPGNGDIIEKNINLNSLTNVTLERKAVGSENGSVYINTLSNSSVIKSEKGIKVELTCLDDYIHLNPTFLKIDVEGFEIQVLQGSKKILATYPKLAIEIHTEDLPQFGGSIQDLFQLIEIQKYRWWIQWQDGQLPVEYDMKTPIEKRVHLFGIPILTESA